MTCARLRNMRIVTPLAVAFAFALFALTTVHAQTSTNYYWCGGPVIEQTSTAYYSDPFETSEQNGWTVTRAWQDYLKTTYGVTPIGTCRSYSFWTSLEDAATAAKRDASFQLSVGKSPVFTHWTY